GYPEPSALMNIRPRYPLKYIAFEDQYKDLTEKEIQECMKMMDEGYLEQGYYVKQSAKIPMKKELGDDKIDYDTYSWSEHISRKMVQGRWGEKPFITFLKECGFKLE
ncbi:MAG: hypothetical protein ACFFDT_16885, partial [Candidatus Hodarchaeota archaeon]